MEQVEPLNMAKSIEDEIENDTNTDKLGRDVEKVQRVKSKTYRISGSP